MNLVSLRLAYLFFTKELIDLLRAITTIMTGMIVLFNR